MRRHPFRFAHEFQTLPRDREFIRAKRWRFVYRFVIDYDKDRWDRTRSWKRYRRTQYHPKGLDDQSSGSLFVAPTPLFDNSH